MDKKPVGTAATATANPLRECESPLCLEVYTPVKPNQRFCSPACKLEAWHLENPNRGFEKQFTKLVSKVGELERRVGELESTAGTREVLTRR